MSLQVTAEPVPLTRDVDGVLRVGCSRVTLDTVVAAFREGMTPEGIVEQYPSLRLAEVYSVSCSRVTLDTVVAAFREGMTPEGIVEQYPSLRLAEVYSVIGYVLNHTEEVEAYLRDRQCLAEAVRLENESRFDPAGVRDRFLARRRPR